MKFYFIAPSTIKLYNNYFENNFKKLNFLSFNFLSIKILRVISNYKIF